MNRTIKFRGKRIDNGEWVYGDLLQTNEGSVCIGVHGQYIDDGMHFNDFYDETPYIDEDTVGQFTGLLDKNGREIYEGDIILCKGKHQYKVEWTTDGFMMRSDWYGGITSIESFLPIQREIIGNIHDDNPELLNEK